MIPQCTGDGSPWQASHTARTASASLLCTLLQNSRERTLALLDLYRAALGDALPVPQADTLNPPLWELGHIAWFQDYWISRNPERSRGQHATLQPPRLASRLLHGDALHDSSQVAQNSRWQLPLPDLATTLQYAQQVLDATLALLQHPGLHSDDDLYFYRLVLLHEDMHGEAWIYMAQALGIDVPDGLLRRKCGAVTDPALTGLHLPAERWQSGWHGAGFAFDNELNSHSVDLPACNIDSQAVTWQRYVPFIEASGYREQQWWSAAGWQWLQSTGQQTPLNLRPGPGPGAGTWQHRCGSAWKPLNLQASATHLSYFEAQAWCAWADRALPTEAQWERAALRHPAFSWGQVWEWTASPFAPYPGFVAHPYRDYSAPWFDGRPVLKGASAATHARMVHPRYRNYFEPQRNDIPAGFRSCEK